MKKIKAGTEDRKPYQPNKTCLVLRLYLQDKKSSHFITCCKSLQPPTHEICMKYEYGWDNSQPCPFSENPNCTFGANVKGRAVPHPQTETR